MEILVDTIRVAGFRGLKNVEVSLQRVCVLIGLNNAGKTSLIKSMQLAFGDYGRHLSDEDFHIPPSEKRSSQIIVDARIVAVDESGKRQQSFSKAWQRELGDKIQADPDGNQYVALRTTAKPNLIKGGFEISRSTLSQWPQVETWTSDKVKGSPMTGRLQSVPIIPIDAQRDIQSDLKDRTSFMGRLLASVEYSDNDVQELEILIGEINTGAVAKSRALTKLKDHLANLNQAVGGEGGAEITPFPKKIRDLSKNFSVNFGDSAETSFSMEYHGMGTRSWASMLSIKAFLELLIDKHNADAKPIHPIIAAEEPEAHLHPNAQRSLYSQLCETKGQLIISTHSPFLAAMADLYEIRSLGPSKNGISSHQIRHVISPEDKKVVAREIMSRKGDLFFSRAIILCEGITEEQVLPSMLNAFLSKSSLSAGVSCVSVGGKNYKPFVAMAVSFGIPVYIMSDNDGNTANEVNAQLIKLNKETSLDLSQAAFGVGFVGAGKDFEAEILDHGLRDEIIESFIRLKVNGVDNPHYLDAQKRVFAKLENSEILTMMRASKASYAGFLADVISDNEKAKSIDQLIPPSINQCFTTIKGWLQ